MTLGLGIGARVCSPSSAFGGLTSTSIYWKFYKQALVGLLVLSVFCGAQFVVLGVA